MYAIADAVVSVLSLLTLVYVLKTTRIAFKKHYLNVFSHLMLILIVFSLLSKYIKQLISSVQEPPNRCPFYRKKDSFWLFHCCWCCWVYLVVCVVLIVRSLFFLTHMDMFKYDDDDDTVGAKAPIFAFIWTYPLINFIVISYTTSSHWVYDLMTLIHGN